jgi:ABC-type bacteriocin/lantibiotic exporter with double-glycine peptidase domain
MSTNVLNGKQATDTPIGKGEFSDRRLVRMLGQFLTPYWLSILLVFLMLIVVTGVSLLPPYLTQLAVDGPIQEGDVDGLVVLGVVYLLTIPTTFALQFAYVYLLQTVGQNALLDLRQRLFEHIL